MMKEAMNQHKKLAMGKMTAKTSNPGLQTFNKGGSVKCSTKKK
jgi:hypothetical protein